MTTTEAMLLPDHEDWCCAKGCAGYGFCQGCDGSEADCQCLVLTVRAYAERAWTAGLIFGQTHWTTNYAGVYKNGNPLREAPNPYRTPTQPASQQPAAGIESGEVD